MTTTVNTAGKIVAFVEIPEDAQDFEMNGNWLCFQFSQFGFDDDYIPMDSDKWQILGDSRTLTEEQMKAFIPNKGGYLFDHDQTLYNQYPDFKTIDHPFDNKWYESVQESYSSMKEANNIDDTATRFLVLVSQE